MTISEERAQDGLHTVFTGQALEEITRLSEELGISTRNMVAFAIRVISDGVDAKVVTKGHVYGRNPSDTLKYEDSWLPHLRLAYIIQSIAALKDIDKIEVTTTDGETTTVEWSKDFHDKSLGGGW